MAKTVKLSENSFHHLLNEITYGKVDDAYMKSSELFDKLYDSFVEFRDTLDNMIQSGETNPYIEKIYTHAQEIDRILSRKKDQSDYFLNNTLNVNRKKFYSEHPDMDIDKAEIGDIDKNYRE